MNTATEHEDTPRYQHDCERCQFLGQHNEADLYFCERVGFGPTVIARYGDEGLDYISGLVMAQHYADLAEAKRRAEREGWLS